MLHSKLTYGSDYERCGLQAALRRVSKFFLDATISFVNFHLSAGYQISEHIL